MATSASRLLMLVVFICAYVYGIKGRPNNLEDEIVVKGQRSFEESDLFKSSKTKGGGEEKGHSRINKGKKKQVIDAYHLGPYHRGHPWGTVSQWPGYHWGAHSAYHGGWTGYPSLGGWHRSRISKKNLKESIGKEDSRRQVLPTVAFPAYGFAYPSLGFAAVPFTPSPLPWGYGVYRSKVPEKPSKGQTRSSVKGSDASKRWWPGYMGGWGGWGIGNAGYPGLSPVGWGPFEDVWGNGFDAFGLGRGWGVGLGDGVHPFLRSGVPGKKSKDDKAEKRWWPGYMGGWGGWGLGNTGYPGWGPLGANWAYGVNPYGYGHGPGLYGYGHGSGLYGFGRGFGLGYGRALNYRAGVPEKKKDKEEGEEEDEEEGPKRQIINEPYGVFGYPWSDYGPGFQYGPFGAFGSPFVGHGAYVPYPASFYGEFLPHYGYAPYGFMKSEIPSKKLKKITKEVKNEEKATTRHFVANFNPGRYGWGGAVHRGYGYHAVLPLLGSYTYSGLYGGYYGPYGPPRSSFGPHHRSYVPDHSDESGQTRQVINYHPGCCGWGGCVYPGCGYIGTWKWPIPCHVHHCHHCAPCWTRSKYPKMQGVREEKGKSRQDIESPGQDDSEDSDSKDPQTHPHLEGSDLLNSEMKHLAMGFPGVENLQTPMGLSNGPETQEYTSEEREDSNESPSPEVAQAAPEETSESAPEIGGLTANEGGNGFKMPSLDNTMEQQGGAGQDSSTGELLSSFSYNPSQGELPAEAFGDTGNPNMYAEGQNAGSPARRTDIPNQEDKAVIKKQAVAYPYGSYYPGYMMAHALNPIYHYTPVNYAAQHMMAYPSVYPLQHPGIVPQPLPADRPSHSIHVGAPSVNIDVHTTRHRIAHNPEKQKGSKLKRMMGDFSKKLKKFRGKKSHWSEGRRKEKRQIPSAFSSPFMNRPMGFSTSQFRYPVSNMAGFVEQSMNPSLQKSLSRVQPFNMYSMSRSGLPTMGSVGMGRHSGLRAPMMNPSLTPAEMAYSRQLSSITGISVPISAQPGMGIVGMASRKKRSSSKKMTKKRSKSTKRQFLAPLPQGVQPSGISPFGLPASPFMGVGLPVFPSIPSPQIPSPQIPSQQTRPMAFRSRTAPPMASKMPQRRLPAMRMASFSSEPFPALNPLGGFPPMPNNPFLRVPQPMNANFLSGGAAGPWAPIADVGQIPSEGAFNGGLGEGFPRRFEDNQGQLLQEMKQQQQGGSQPFQISGEQLAGFNNPSGLNVIEQQPTPMFSEVGRGTEAAGPLTIRPQSGLASFIDQLPTEAGLIESNNFNMQPGLGAMKKSSLPARKKQNKRKGI